VYHRDDGRIEVMLEIDPPRFEAAPPDLEAAARALGISTDDFAARVPVEVARGDFVHLVLPLTGLDAMHRIDPDFGAIVDYCHRHDIETFAAFCLETQDPNSTLHVRDFCPAVGVAESSSAGTTNAALSCYLLRHALVPDEPMGIIEIHAEQGLELGRPSSIRSRIATSAGAIGRLQVGGVATRVLLGEVYLPS
jgi:PhzF family phenazine biosynthesis protein